MARAFSLDLRTRIVHACEQHEFSQSELADVFQVHVKTVEKYWQLSRTGQDLAPRPHTAGPPRKLAGHDDDVRALLAAQPDLTLAACAAELETRYQIQISLSALCRHLQRLGLPRKRR